MTTKGHSSPELADLTGRTDSTGLLEQNGFHFGGVMLVVAFDGHVENDGQYFDGEYCATTRRKHRFRD